jgi:hypothetical protein
VTDGQCRAAVDLAKACLLERLVLEVRSRRDHDLQKDGLGGLQVFGAPLQARFQDDPLLRFGTADFLHVAAHP